MNTTKSVQDARALRKRRGSGRSQEASTTKEAEGITRKVHLTAQEQRHRQYLAKKKKKD